MIPVVSNNYIVMDDPNNRHALVDRANSSTESHELSPQIPQTKDDSSDSESREIADIEVPQIHQTREDSSESESREIAIVDAPQIPQTRVNSEPELNENIRINIPQRVIPQRVYHPPRARPWCNGNALIIATVAIAVIVLVGGITAAVYSLKDAKFAPLSRKDRMALGCAFAAFFILKFFPGNRRRRGMFGAF